MKKTTLILALVLFAVPSCVKHSINIDSTSRQLKLIASIDNNVSTKSIVHGSTFPTGSEIGVQLINYTDGAPYLSSGITNLRFVSDSIGEFKTIDSCMLRSNKAVLYAYFPFTNISDNKQTFSEIPISIPDLAECRSDVDYMFAIPIEQEPNLVSSLNNSVDLVMNHALTQVSILVYKENYSGNGLLTEYSIKDDGVSSHIKVNQQTNNDLRMNISNGQISGGQNGVVVRVLSNPLTIQRSSLSPEFPSSDVNILRTQVNQFGVSTLLCPTQTISRGDICFSLKIDGVEYKLNNTSDIMWERGKQYIYKVKLSGLDLTLTSVSIVDWFPVLGDDMEIK